MVSITLLLECDMTQMPKEHLEQAKDFFAWIIQEHMKDNRTLTTIKIFKEDGQLKILELSND